MEVFDLVGQVRRRCILRLLLAAVGLIVGSAGQPCSFCAW